MRKSLLFLSLFFSIVAHTQEMRLVLPVGHTKSISCIEFTKDNKKIVSGSEDGTIRLWDMVSGKELMVYTGHFGAIKQLALYQEDQRIISIAEDNTLKVWDLKTGKCLFNLEGHNERINHFALSPDKSIVASVGEDRLTNINRLSDGKLMSSHEYFDWGAQQIAFDSTGTRFLTYDDNRFIIHSIPGDSLQLDVAMSVQQLLLIPSSNSVALNLFMHNEIVLIDLTRNKLTKLRSQLAEISQIAVSNSGEMMITTNGKDSLELWSLKNNMKRFNLIRPYSGENDILKYYISNDDQKIFITDYVGNTEVYSSNDGKEIYSLSDAGNSTCLLFPKNCSYYIAGLTDNSIQVREVKDGYLNQRILGKSNSVMYMNLVDSSNVIISIIASAQKNSIMTNGGVMSIVGVEKNTGKLLYQLDRLKYHFESLKGNDFYFSLIDINGFLTVFNRKSGEQVIEHQLKSNDIVDVFFNEKLKDQLEIYYVDGKVEFINCWENSRSEISHIFNNLKSVKPFGDGQKIWYVDSLNRIILVNRLTNELVFKKEFKKKDEVSFIEGSSSSFLLVGTKKITLYTYKDNIVNSVSLNYQRIADEPHKFYSYDDKLIDVRDFVFNDAYINASKTILKIRIDHNSVQFFEIKSGNLLRVMTIDAFSEENDAYCTFIDDKICHFVPRDEELENEQVPSSNQEQFKFIYEDILDQTKAVDLTGHSDAGLEAKGSGNSDYFITSAWDGTSIYWSKKDGKKLATSMILDNNNWITFLPTGHFYCSKDASKYLHYVDAELNVITFDQLDLKFNRPDLILRALGIRDTIEIASFYNAYLKRIKRLKIDTNTFSSNFSLPQLALSNSLKYDNSFKEFSVHIQASDKLAKLERFNVWINEVPVFGERGFTLINKQSKSLDTTFILYLSEGENRIEASVTNSNAIESYRSPIYINYNPEKPIVSKTHFIGIGIDHFKEPDHDLSYSVKDVRDLALALKEKLGDQLTIDTLFNQNVSFSNVQALKKKLLQTNINDKVIISYSGHGLLNDEYDYFLSSYHVDFHHPENGGIPYEVLEDLLDSIPARKKLLLIDACHSGEVDKEDMREMAAVAGAKGIVKPKGGDSENTSGTQTIGLENSFQLMQELFVNVQKGSGATIISAAAGDQFALEGGKLENGFFTYAILKFMQENESVSINALKKYIYTEVETLSGGLQKPTSRIENLEMDWRVW